MRQPVQLLPRTRLLGEWRCPRPSSRPRLRCCHPARWLKQGWIPGIIHAVWVLLSRRSAV